MMKLERISAKNIDLTPAIEEHVMKRVQKLLKIVQNQKPATIRVELGKPLERRKKTAESFYVEFTVTIQDRHFQVRKTDPSIYRAIEKVRVDMHQKIIKWKKRERSAHRRRGLVAKNMVRFGHDDK